MAFKPKEESTFENLIDEEGLLVADGDELHRPKVRTLLAVYLQRTESSDESSEEESLTGISDKEN